MCCLQDNVYIKLVKGAHGVAKALQAAHSSYWGIWGDAPSETLRGLLLRTFCAQNVTISYVLASRISATHPHTGGLVGKLHLGKEA